MMKYFIYFILLMVFTMNIPLTFADTLHAGLFQLVPHIIYSKQDKEFKGAAIDYLNHLSVTMGVQIVIDSYPLSRLLYNLKKGKIDLAVALGKNPNREKFCNYPEKPFTHMQPAILVLKESSLNTLTSFDEIPQLKIGVYLNGYLSPGLKESNLILEEMSGENIILRNFQKLKIKRIDAVYSPDYLELLYSSKKYNFFEDIKIINLPESAIGLYTVFSKHTNLLYVKKYEEALRNAEKYELYTEKYLKGK